MNSTRARPDPATQEEALRIQRVSAVVLGDTREIQHIFLCQFVGS